jgi:hypothetical protein
MNAEGLGGRQPAFAGFPDRPRQLIRARGAVPADDPGQLLGHLRRFFALQQARQELGVARAAAADEPDARKVAVDDLKMNFRGAHAGGTVDVSRRLGVGFHVSFRA